MEGRVMRRSLTLMLAGALALPLAVAAPGAGTAAAHPSSVSPPRVLAAFDPAAGEQPESVAVDREGNAYVSLVGAGEVVRVSPAGERTTLARFPRVLALLLAEDGSVLVNVLTFRQGTHGVWRVAPNGDTSLFAALPPSAVPNGIAADKAGNVYIADSRLARIWRVPVGGANGLQVFRGDVYVSNSDQGTLLRAPITASGAPGGLETVATHLPADDFTFDVRGNIYVTTDPFQTVVRIAPDGTREVLLTEEDGLDGPTAATFGRHGRDRRTLYVTNAAFPQFQGTSPTLITVDLGIPGQPPALGPAAIG
jgi:sugar lactone lactonase YvrE